MGTRIEPTINHNPAAGLPIDQDVDVAPDAGNRAPVPAPGDTDASTDPTLAELAALENEVDNWLHAPVKAEPAAIEPEPLPAQEGPEPVPVRAQEEPPPRPPPAKRAKRPVAWWALGAGALAAIVGAVVLLDEPSKPGQALEPVVASTPAPSPAPAQAAIAPVPPPSASKPDMVFLEQPPAAAAKAAEPQAKPAEDKPAIEPQQRNTVDSAVAAVNAPVKAEKPVAPKKAKPAKKPVRAPEPAQPTQTWPPDRRGSDARRVEAARAACRARSPDPGACHIRVCDVLGSSHPACRD